MTNPIIGPPPPPSDDPIDSDPTPLTLPPQQQTGSSQNDSLGQNIDAITLNQQILGVLGLEIPRLGMADFLDSILETRSELLQTLQETSINDPINQKNFHQNMINTANSRIGAIVRFSLAREAVQKNQNEIETQEPIVDAQAESTNDSIDLYNEEIDALNSQDPYDDYNNIVIEEAQTMLDEGATQEEVRDYVNGEIADLNAQIQAYNDRVDPLNSGLDSYDAELQALLDLYETANAELTAEAQAQGVEPILKDIPNFEFVDVDPRPIETIPLIEEVTLDDFSGGTGDPVTGGTFDGAEVTSPVPDLEFIDQVPLTVPTHEETQPVEILEPEIILNFVLQLLGATSRFKAGGAIAFEENFEQDLAVLVSVIEDTTSSEDSTDINFVSTTLINSASLVSASVGLSGATLSRLFNESLIDFFVKTLFSEEVIPETERVGGLITNAITQDLLLAALQGGRPIPFLFDNSTTVLTPEIVLLVSAINVAVNLALLDTSGVLDESLAGVLAGLATNPDAVAGELASIEALSLLAIGAALIGNAFGNTALLENTILFGLILGLPGEQFTDLFLQLQAAGLTPNELAAFKEALGEALELILVGAGVPEEDIPGLIDQLTLEITQPNAVPSELFDELLINVFGNQNPETLALLFQATNLSLALATSGGFDFAGAFSALTQEGFDRAIQTAIAGAGVTGEVAERIFESISQEEFKERIAEELSSVAFLLGLSQAVTDIATRFGLDTATGREIVRNVLTELTFSELQQELGAALGEEIKGENLEHELGQFYSHLSETIGAVTNQVVEKEDEELTAQLVASLQSSLSELLNIDPDQLAKLLEPSQLVINVGIQTETLGDKGPGVNLMPSGGERGSIDIQA